MADLEPALVEADWSRLTAAVVALGRQPALVVLLTAARAGRRRARPAAGAARAGPAGTGWCWPRCATPSSTGWPPAAGDPTEVYDAAAAEQVLADRARTAESSARLGVDVVDADAERLPVRSPTTT